MMQRDFYQVLGVSQDASANDIRAAFARLSKRHHPDLADRDLAMPWRVHDVQEAYHCLSDATTRAAHDHDLANDKRRHFARQRTLQRRLYSFDRRHPRRLPRPYRRVRWKMLIVVALILSFVVQYLRIIG